MTADDHVHIRPVPPEDIREHMIAAHGLGRQRENSPRRRQALLRAHDDLHQHAHTGYPEHRHPV